MVDDLLKGNSRFQVRGSVAFTGVRVKPKDNATEGVVVLLGNTVIWMNRTTFGDISRDRKRQLDTIRVSALN